MIGVSWQLMSNVGQKNQYSKIYDYLCEGLSTCTHTRAHAHTLFAFMLGH